MTEVKIQVDGAHAGMAEKVGRLTTGMVGAVARFSFDGVWDGLTKVAVFKGSGVTRDVLEWNGDAVKIPAEVLREDGRLYVGVEGRNDDGSLVIPTVWADCGVVLCGAESSGDPSVDPALPVWQQFQNQMGDLAQLQTRDKESLVAAINEVRKNAAGGISDEQVAQSVADYLDAHPVTPGATTEQAEQIEANTEAIKQLQQTGGGIRNNFIPAKTRISAHRGDMESYPENTIPAFRSAGEKGAWSIETDVRMTKDGVLVCVHNSTVDATTDGTGAVSSFTLEQIQALSIDYGEAYGNYSGVKLSIPLFSDYLAICKEFGCVAQIHIQTGLGAAYIRSVYDAVKAAGMLDSSCYASWDIGDMRTLRAIAPDVLVFPAYNYVTKTEIDAVLALGGPVGVHVGSVYDGITADVLKYARENGVLIFSGFGTTNDPAAPIKYLTELGVDVITSTYLSYSQLGDLPNHSVSDVGKALVIGSDGKPVWKTVQAESSGTTTTESEVPLGSWEMGNIHEGAEYDVNNRIRTVDYLKFTSDTIKVVPSDGYSFAVLDYTSEKVWIGGLSSVWVSKETTYQVDTTHFYRINICRTDGASMTVDEGSNLKVYEIEESTGESSGNSYTLPVASAKTLGGIKADPVESTDTQPVRIGEDGKLYTAPGGGNGGETVGSVGWELIYDSVLEEDGDSAATMLITKNAEGKEFAYRQIWGSVVGTVMDKVKTLSYPQMIPYGYANGVRRGLGYETYKSGTLSGGAVLQAWQRYTIVGNAMIQEGDGKYNNFYGTGYPEKITEIELKSSFTDTDDNNVKAYCPIKAGGRITIYGRN